MVWLNEEEQKMFKKVGKLVESLHNKHFDKTLLENTLLELLSAKTGRDESTSKEARESVKELMRFYRFSSIFRKIDWANEYEFSNFLNNLQMKYVDMSISKELSADFCDFVSKLNSLEEDFISGAKEILKEMCEGTPHRYYQQRRNPFLTEMIDFCARGNYLSFSSFFLSKTQKLLATIRDATDKTTEERQFLFSDFLKKFNQNLQEVKTNMENKNTERFTSEFSLTPQIAIFEEIRKTKDKLESPRREDIIQAARNFFEECLDIRTSYDPKTDELSVFVSNGAEDGTWISISESEIQYRAEDWYNALAEQESEEYLEFLDENNLEPSPEAEKRFEEEQESVRINRR